MSDEASKSPEADAGRLGRDVGRPAPERANACKLTECQGKPRCKPCMAMDAAYSGGWRPMHEAPKDAGPVLLLVPTRWAKRSTHIQTQGEWMAGRWFLFDADEAIQPVDPICWRPLHEHPASMPPNVRANTDKEA
jgi:hypothetical protein